MARGWESKSVESQQDADKDRAGHGQALTPGQRAIEQKRSSLELSRRRVLQDLAAAGSPLRRASLEQALAFLEEEIRKLEGG